jgi:molybdopterin synthase sulfur carrier subunit
MRVLLFGPLRDVAGWREWTMAAPSACLTDLKAVLTARDPALGQALERPGVQIAVDKAIVRGDATLSADAEVAFLPPMSGG